MRVFVFLGLVLLISALFPIYVFQFVLPSELFEYPRKSMSNSTVYLYHALFEWALPGFASGLFMKHTGLMSRIAPGFGTNLIKISVAITFAGIALRIIAGLIPGGGAGFTLGVLLHYISIPVRVALVIGVMHMLVNLRPKSGV